MARGGASTLSGGTALEGVLKKLPERVRRNVARQAVTAGAQVIVEEIRGRTRVGKTGHLRDSIGQVGVKSPDKSMVIRAVGALKRGGKKGYHAHLLEFGTVKMAARPFVRPGFDAGKREALKVMGTRLGRGVEKAARKLAGSFAKSGLKTRRRR